MMKNILSKWWFDNELENNIFHERIYNIYLNNEVIKERIDEIIKKSKEPVSYYLVEFEILKLHFESKYYNWLKSYVDTTDFNDFDKIKFAILLFFPGSTEKRVELIETINNNNELEFIYLDMLKKMQKEILEEKKKLNGYYFSDLLKKIIEIAKVMMILISDLKKKKL